MAATGSLHAKIAAWEFSIPYFLFGYVALLKTGEFLFFDSTEKADLFSKTKVKIYRFFRAKPLLLDEAMKEQLIHMQEHIHRFLFARHFVKTRVLLSA